MDILFFTHYFPPEGNAPASRTYDNCKRWVQAGHNVTVVTCAPNVPDGKVYEGYRNRLRQEEIIDGIRVIRVWTFMAPNRGAVRRTVNYLSYLFSSVFFAIFLKRPDIIVTTSPQFFCGLAGILLGRTRNLPVILEIRDIWPESITAVGALKPSLGIRLLEKIERYMYRKATRIVTVGKGYQEKLLERGVEREKIEIITNGADLEFYKVGETDANLLKEYGLADKFTVAYIGTIGMAAGLEIVLEAARLLKSEGDDSIRFVLVGDGAEREHLEGIARKENLSAVVFTGRLPKEKIPSLLNSVDVCLVHLRKSELFKTVLPSKMFEAFATARPVILGVDGNAREILEEANAGIFIEPGNAEKMLESVRNLQMSACVREQLGRNGLRHVRVHFDRDSLAEDYLEILGEVFNVNYPVSE